MTDPSLWASVTGWITSFTLFLFLNLVIGTIVVTSRFSSNRKPRPQHLSDQLGRHEPPRQLARAPSFLDRVKSINFDLYKFPSQEHDLQVPETQSYHQPTEPAYYANPVEPDPPQLARAPSLLNRVKSFNFFLYKFPSHDHEEELQRAQEPHCFDQSTEPAYDSTPVEPSRTPLARAPSLLERVKSINLSSVYRSQQTYPEAKTEPVYNTEAEGNPGHKPKRGKSETKKSKGKVQESMKKSVSEKSMTVEKDEVEGEAEAVERRKPQTARLERTVTVGDGDHAVDAKADDFINKFKRQLRLQRLDSLLRYKEMLQ